MSSRTSFQNSASRPSSSSAVPSLAAVADPALRHVDGAAMDYFVIEMVNTLRASSAVAAARAKKTEQEMVDAGLMPASAPVPPPLKKSQLRESIASNASRTSLSKDAKDEDEEELRARLEAIGMHVGANMAERLCHDRGLFSDTLDAVKFICKDLWSACWEKQVDNLRTNHRGVYVLQDNSFKPLTRISGWEGRAESLRRAKVYAAMPAGIIRGALARVGYQAAVVPEVTALPQCTFQVKLPKGS